MQINQMIATFLNVFPVILILWITFKDRLKRPGYLDALSAIAVFMVVSFISTYIYFTQPITPGIMMLISLMSMILGVFIFNTVCRYNFIQCMFTVFIVKCYMDDTYLLSVIIYYLIAGKPVIEPDALHLVSLLCITLLTFPLALLYFEKLMLPAMDSTGNLSFWKWLCSIPICNTIIYNLLVFPEFRHTVPVTAVNRYIIPLAWITLTTLIYVVILKSILDAIRNVELNEELDSSEYLLSVQEKQLLLLQNKIEETRHIRHDFHHTLNALNSYLKSKDYEQMEDYINQNLVRFDNVIPVIYCKNTIINSIVSHYMENAKKYDIDMSVKIDIMEHLPLPDIDLCIILGNLLENALEACMRQNSDRRFIKLNMTAQNKYNMVMIVRNSYEGLIQQKGELFFSSKEEGRVGIGISSVLRVVSKYGGVANFDYNDGTFKASVLLSSNNEGAPY